MYMENIKSTTRKRLIYKKKKKNAKNYNYVIKSCIHCKILLYIF